MEPLAPANLTLPKEKTYFAILIIFSCLIWLLCIVSIVPIVGLIIGGFVGWLVHGLLIARIKSEAVKLDANQMPELAAAFAGICGNLNLKSVPELYLMQSGGILNAFATRHCARDFVVIYSDILEAYGGQSDEIKFLLGHEIGHIRSSHIFKNMLLLPGMFLPLIGSAYSRACESSCDRHGAFASGDPEASVRAMMILSGGKRTGRELMADAFSNQHHVARGFFVSLHELFSAYPTLSKRVSDLLDLQHGRSTPKPGRNPLAYLIGLFCPGVRFGVVGVVLTVYMVAILCGIALPVITKVQEKAKAAQELQRRIQSGESGQPDEKTPSLPSSDQ
jgi:Zn-dependent protease with chaperone function